jgi:preprotein translocase subunit Sec61beta
VLRGYDEILADIRSFGESDPQQAFLSRDLSRQEPFYRDNALLAASMAAHTQFYEAYDIVAGGLGVQYVVVAGFLIWLVLVSVRAFRPDRQRPLLGLAVAAVAILIVLGASLFESPFPRYRMPAQPLLLLGFALGLSELSRLFRRQRTGGGEANDSPRGGLAHPE